jgi:hypothetical protein
MESATFELGLRVDLNNSLYIRLVIDEHAVVINLIIY